MSSLFGWILIVLMGKVYKTGRYVTITKRSLKRYRAFSWRMIISFTLILFIILIAAVFHVDYLLMPSIAVIIGYGSLRADKGYYEAYSSVLKKNYYLITPLFNFASVIINLTGFFLLGWDFVLYHGLIFGLTSDISIMGVAFLNKMDIQKYVENLEDNIEEEE
ncbi:MAG: hypothetical protein ACFFBD_05040 [Candidatus Hodarchaeota archaeon]